MHSLSDFVRKSARPAAASSPTIPITTNVRMFLFVVVPFAAVRLVSLDGGVRTLGLVDTRGTAGAAEAQSAIELRLTEEWPAPFI